MCVTSRTHDSNLNQLPEMDKMNLENLNSNFSLVLSHISADDVERDRLFEEEDFISMDEHHMFMQPFEHVSEGRYKILAD